MNRSYMAYGLLSGACLVTALAAGDDACVYSNHNPLDDDGAVPSQEDIAYWWHAEAADDIVLPGEPHGECLLSRVTTAVTFYFLPLGATPDPFLCWTGVNITIYEDGAAFCGKGFVTGPAGEPTDSVHLPNIEYCPGSIVCEVFATLDRVEAFPIASACVADHYNWNVTVFDLEDQACTLKTNHTYWIAISPQQTYPACGQTAILLSANDPVDQPAQLNFLLLGIPWTPVDGNGNACPPDSPPAGAHRDLSMEVVASPKAIDCPWDLNVDGEIGPSDLALILGAWGEPYGPADLADLLGAWGPC